MSTDKRVMTIDGSSAANTIDPEHNLFGNPFRLVSSDGVLFTVSADTLRHMHVLWDMAQSPTMTSSEIVLSDDEFEHSNSVRLLLDLLVHGVVGRSSYAVDHIADAIDLSLKYDCHCGHEHCLSYIESAIARGLPPASSAMCELFVLAGQLDEARIAKLVVRALAKAQLKINIPAHLCWQVGQVAGTPPQYLCAMERALLPTLHHNYTYGFPSADAAVERFENGLANFDGHRTTTTAKHIRGAARREQKPWRLVHSNQPANEGPSPGARNATSGFPFPLPQRK